MRASESPRRNDHIAERFTSRFWMAAGRDWPSPRARRGPLLGGQAALERLGQAVYDLVVCDLAMPDVDGAAVTRAVEHLAPPRPALLLMTGYADGPTYAEFLQTTPAVVLNKPLGIEALREHVRRLLENR